MRPRWIDLFDLGLLVFELVIIFPGLLKIRDMIAENINELKTIYTSILSS